MPMLVRAAAMLALALLSACGNARDGGPAGELPSAMVDCVAAKQGYELRFPEDWFTNDAGIAEPCRFFHPEPFTVDAGTEAAGIAVSVRLNPMSADQVTPSSDGPSAAETVERRATTVSGRAAVRLVTVATEGALRPEGARAVSWFVDASNGTVVATTSEAASAGRFQENVDVLDAMVHSLRLFQPQDCSAAQSAPDPVPQPDLPELVSEIRMQIIQAASACDYSRLAELALAGDSTFSFSFGGGEEPADFWRAAEGSGEAPLRLLVELLDGPFGTRSVDGVTQYLWPSAYAYERWDDVPQVARDHVADVYDEETLARFEQFGSYLGHRVGITGTGDWVFYIAGD
jgi:hypothetical protein